jgi:hypothetical protein
MLAHRVNSTANMAALCSESVAASLLVNGTAENISEGRAAGLPGGDTLSPGDEKVQSVARQVCLAFILAVCQFII